MDDQPAHENRRAIESCVNLHLDRSHGVAELHHRFATTIYRGRDFPTIDPFPMIHQNLTVDLQHKRVLCRERGEERSRFADLVGARGSCPNVLACLGPSHRRPVNAEVLPVDQRFLIHAETAVVANKRKFGRRLEGELRIRVRDENVHGRGSGNQFTQETLWAETSANKLLK